MLKKLLFFTILIFQIITVSAQLNINLVGQLTFPSHGDMSDIWGHVDATGKEYALVGTEDGTSIVDISNPAAPVEVFFSGGATTIWRDLKVWNNHVYITNDNGGGSLKIIDMSNLPGPITAADVYTHTGTTYPFTIAHDIYIDENGYAYVMGADNGNGGAIILDLNTNPKVPVEVGRYDDYYLHDGMVRGDTLWGGAIGDGFFVVVDVSNKAAPVTMATQNTPSTFTHNCWISDDGHTLFTTDEKSNAFIGSYDVSNLSNISELDRIQSSPGDLVIPHNTFVLGDYVVTSYYRDGVTIHDVTDPSNMVEVGNYDTSPAFIGDGFNGCWGVYPYLPSGLIIATDIENGLYILGPTYTRASYLDGNVTDSVTTFSLDGVQIDIVSTTIATNTNILGDYQTGLAIAGTYSVTYSKYGYETKTVVGVSLTSGNITTVNVELKPLPSFTLQGQVIETGSSNPIANATVTIESGAFTTTVQTDGAGNFSLPGFIEGIFDIYIAKWGYNQLCLTNQTILAINNPFTYQLDDGYYDDFRFDLGWTVTSNASSGDWEKGVPVGTSFWGSQSNPGNDSQSDCNDEAYITGNAGGGGGDDDVDDGETILTSPVFDLSGYNDPYLYFDRWFFNAGGSGTPNDSLIIELMNGTTVVQVDVAIESDPDASSWASKTIQISSVITPTNSMQLRVRTMDDNPGHIVEAGFDKFQVKDSIAASVEGVDLNDVLTIYPNPFNSETTISLHVKDVQYVKIEVLDITGRMIDEQEFKNTSVIRIKNDYKQGVYFMNVYGNGKLIKTEKVIKL